MKIGDKVLVTFRDGSQATGYIIGESKDKWKIDFFDDDRPQGVSKSLETFEVIIEDTTIGIKPNVRPAKKKNWKVIGIVAAVVVIAIVLIIVL